MIYRMQISAHRLLVPSPLVGEGQGEGDSWERSLPPGMAVCRLCRSKKPAPAAIVKGTRIATKVAPTGETKNS